jgi:hypothetical protein
MLSLLVSGCSNGKLSVLANHDSAVCDGLLQPINQLNDALLIDGGNETLIAGDRVIVAYDAGCN